MIRAVVDTNVLVAALRSASGASYEILRRLRQGEWSAVLGNTMLGEYHEILQREAGHIGLTFAEVDVFIDGFCLLAERLSPTTPWQPVAADPDDEAIIQVAREAEVGYIVTHNVRDMGRAAEFGVNVTRPAEFLSLLRRQT
jgi:predicted nucleic acid-binding protein